MVPDPTNIFDLILRLLVALGLLLTATTGRDHSAGGSPDGSGQAGSAGTYRSMTLIDRVDVLVQESYPYRLSLVVTGSQPDGCEWPVIVEQERAGDQVTVQIYRDAPLDVMCPMVLLPYSATIPLDGSFESGQYRINVNGTIVVVTL